MERATGQLDVFSQVSRQELWRVRHLSQLPPPLPRVAVDTDLLSAFSPLLKMRNVPKQFVHALIAEVLDPQHDDGRPAEVVFIPKLVNPRLVFWAVDLNSATQCSTPEVKQPVAAST